VILLCDSAQSVGGKLYILGGAWNVVQRAPEATGVNVTVAVKLKVPWDLANHRMNVHVRLLTVDGDPVSGAVGPVEAGGQLEVARGLGLPQGMPLISTFVLPFAWPEIDAGDYVFELQVGDRTVATEAFLIR
jgi:hypothetical protein